MRQPALHLTTVASLCLFGAAASAQMTAQPPAGGDDAMPPAASLVEQGLAAMGGRDTFDTIRTMHATVEMNTGPQGMTHQLWHGPEDRWRYAIQVMGMNVEMGSDGEHVWAYDPVRGNYQIMPERAEEQTRGNIVPLRTPVAVHELARDAAAMTTDQATVFNTRKAWRVRVEPKQTRTVGRTPASYLYFDMENGMPLGLETPAKGMPMIIKFKEWAEPREDGFVFPKKIVTESGQRETEITFTSIKINPVQLDFFALPEEVRKLVPQKPQGDPTSTTRPAPDSGNSPAGTGGRRGTGTGGGG